MNYLDMSRAVDWIEVRWPNSKAWENWEALTEDFAGFTPGAVMEALHQVYQGGSRFAPSPSELMKAVRPVQARRVQEGTDSFDLECESHTWAAGSDLWECVKCGETSPAPRCGHPYKGPDCPYCADGLPVRET